jgi:transposase-like protein
MASKTFTKEEMEHLRACPYVLNVTPNTVFFSAEFKEMFWKALQEGKSAQEIVTDHGLDPYVLGKTRLEGLKGMIKKAVRAGEGFRDLTTYEAYLKEYTDPEARIKRLEQQLAYKNQEIEFLKKIVRLGETSPDS